MINLIEKINNIRSINSKLLDLEEKFIEIDNDTKNKIDENKNKEIDSKK